MRDSTTCWNPGWPHILFATRFCSASFPCLSPPSLPLLQFRPHCCIPCLSQQLPWPYSPHGSSSPQLDVWASLEDSHPYPHPIQSLNLTCPHPPETYILATKSLATWSTWQSVVCASQSPTPCLVSKTPPHSLMQCPLPHPHSALWPEPQGSRGVGRGHAVSSSRHHTYLHLGLRLRRGVGSTGIPTARTPGWGGGGVALGELPVRQDEFL